MRSANCACSTGRRIEDHVYVRVNARGARHLTRTCTITRTNYGREQPQIGTAVYSLTYTSSISRLNYNYKYVISLVYYTTITVESARL